MDLEQTAIERLKMASDMSLRLYKQPLVITYSGGKDSDVLLHLAGRSGIPYEVLHSLTTADAPVVFEGEANVQALIDSMRKRLCRQADPETRAYAEDFKAALHEIQPEISDVLVPNCIYRCGCPEMQTCGLYESWSRLRPEVMSTYIQHRYDIYNSMFWKAREKRGNDSGD